MNKKFVLMGLLALGTVSVSTVRAEEAKPEKWTCSAQGKQSFGGPVGDIYMTVRGTGNSESSAMNSAQQECFSQGLQMCMVTDCYKN